MNFLETLKTFVPAKELFKKNGVYLLCTNLGLRKVVNGRYTCEEELRKVMIEEIKEYEANFRIEKRHWCPDYASWDEIRVRLQSLFKLSDNSYPRKRTIDRYLERQEPKREAWHYC